MPNFIFPLAIPPRRGARESPPRALSHVLPIFQESCFSCNTRDSIEETNDSPPLLGTEAPPPTSFIERNDNEGCQRRLN